MATSASAWRQRVLLQQHECDGGAELDCESWSRDGVDEQAGGKVLNNTLTENGGDYGIKVSDLSAPVIRNNILKGYQTGCRSTTI